MRTILLKDLETDKRTGLQSHPAHVLKVGEQ